MDSHDIIQLIDLEEQKELKDIYKIELLDKIDEGSFGVVFKGRDLSDNTFCAVKVTQSYKEKYSCIETSIIRSLDHPNIVKFKKFIELEQNKYIVMEYVSSGTLYQLIEDRKLQNNPFNENEISQIMNHLVSALKSMHENNVIHRDIKPENILLGSREDLTQLKLSDFGLSVKYQDGVPFKQYSQKCGTIIFMAPEMLAEKQYSKPVDVWSCGIILYMLFTMGKHPFKLSSENRDDYIKKLIALDPSKEELEDVFPSELAKDLFLRMINKEPSNRYTASQVLKHPFITRKLNSNIPLSFQEKTRIFQNETNLVQKSIKHQDTSNKSLQQSKNSITTSPIKIKQNYSEKDFILPPKTDRLHNAHKKSIQNDSIGAVNLSLKDHNNSSDFTTQDEDYLKNRLDSPARHFRINSNRIQDQNRNITSSTTSTPQNKLPTALNMKLKLQIPSHDSFQSNKSQNSLKSQTNSPNQPNSALSNQSRDGLSPLTANSKGQIQNLNSLSSQNSNYSKFYNESPAASAANSSSKNGLLPSIGKSPQQNSSQIFFSKKDNNNNNQAIFSPASNKNNNNVNNNNNNNNNNISNNNNVNNTQKLSSHGQRAQRNNNILSQQQQQQQSNTSIKTNSLQRPIQSSSNTTLQGSMTTKQVRKGSQNFQIKLLNNPHQSSLSSISSINQSFGLALSSNGTCGSNTNNSNILNSNSFAASNNSIINNENGKISRNIKQQSFHKQNNGCEIVSSNSTDNIKSVNSKNIPKSYSQTVLQSKDYRPGTRSKEQSSYKLSQFSSQGIKDSDLISPQTNSQSVFTFNSFNHNQRLLTESRKFGRVHKDSFEYLECEENI